MGEKVSGKGGKLVKIDNGGGAEEEKGEWKAVRGRWWGGEGERPCGDHRQSTVSGRTCTCRQ